MKGNKKNMVKKTMVKNMVKRSCLWISPSRDNQPLLSFWFGYLQIIFPAYIFVFKNTAANKHSANGFITCLNNIVMRYFSYIKYSFKILFEIVIEHYIL